MASLADCHYLKHNHGIIIHIIVSWTQSTHSQARNHFLEKCPGLARKDYVSSSHVPLPQWEFTSNTERDRYRCSQLKTEDTSFETRPLPAGEGWTDESAPRGLIPGLLIAGSVPHIFQSCPVLHPSSMPGALSMNKPPFSSWEEGRGVLCNRQLSLQASQRSRALLALWLERGFSLEVLSCPLSITPLQHTLEWAIRARLTPIHRDPAKPGVLGSCSVTIRVTLLWAVKSSQAPVLPRTNSVAVHESVFLLLKAVAWWFWPMRFKTARENEGFVSH